MEFLKVAVLFAVCVMFQSCNGQEQPPQCVQEMMAKPGFMSCMQGFMGYMANQQEALQAAAQSGDQAKIMGVYCTPEGKDAMSCMMKYIQNCSEITQQAGSGGMDFTKIFQQGGLDAACAIMTGPCSRIQECLKEEGGMEMGGPGSQSGPGSTGMTMNVKTANPFAYFVQESTMACGPMKERYDCIMKHMDQCKDEVKKIEEMLKTMADAFIQEDMAIASYDQMKQFMKEECPKVPKDFATDTCVQTNLMSQEYAKCYKNASDMAMKIKDDKCGLYKLQSKCLNIHLGMKCGEEKANFMKNNMNLIIKEVPSACALEDTSSAPRSVQVAITTVFTLALSLFIIL